MLRLNPSSHIITVRKGDEASLTLIVCADPRPRNVAWEWGSLRLEAGTSYGTHGGGNSVCAKTIESNYKVKHFQSDIMLTM